MSEDAKRIETEQQQQPGELTGQELKQVSGADTVKWQNPDEGPEETVTFEYGKLGVIYTNP
jgi:hypothetical protein